MKRTTQSAQDREVHAGRVAHTHKARDLVLVMLCGLIWAAAPAQAFSPTFILGGSAEHASSDADDGTAWFDLYGIGSWRMPFESGGYAALNGNALLSYTPESDGLTHDEESLTGTLGLPAPGGKTVWEAGLQTSVDDVRYGTTLRPEWRGRYTYAPVPDGDSGSDGTAEPYLEYSGYAVSQEAGSNDRVSHTAALGLSLDPSIRRGYRFEAAGTAEKWSGEWSDEYAPSSDARRRDLIATGTAELTGLAGYFADWALTMDGGVRLSNDEDYFTDAGRETGGNDFAFGSLEGELSWGPTRRLHLSFLLYGEGRRYLERKIQRDDGSTGSNRLASLEVGGSLEFDWTSDDRTFFLFSLSGGKTVSNDPRVDSWNFSIGGGIEYGF